MDTIAEYDKQHNRLYSQLDDLHSRLHSAEHELNTLRQQQLPTNAAAESSSNNNTWNKEVKSLDARISDVLGKIKEREMSLVHHGNHPGASGASGELAESRLKCERLQVQLNEAHSKIAQLSQQMKQFTSPIATVTSQQPQQQQQQQGANLNIQDFSDDLAKVLMSKEEVRLYTQREIILFLGGDI